MNLAARTISHAFPSQGIVVDIGGNDVDCTDWEWRIPSPTNSLRLKWRSFPCFRSDIITATAEHIAKMVRSKSVSHIRGTFDALLLLANSATYRGCDNGKATLEESFFGELKQHLGKDISRLAYIRKWYCDCSSMGYDVFSAEVAYELEQKVIGGNRKGHAVLSLDPEEGPLSDVEVSALTSALVAQTRAPTLSTEELVAVWLCVSFGSNPGQLALLREKDVMRIAKDSSRFTYLQIPRMKKRAVKPRKAFKKRKLIAEIARPVYDLIRKNRLVRRRSGWSSETHAFPLFVRKTARPDLIGGPMDEYARHLSSREFTDLFEMAIAKLAIISPRTGKILFATPRRLRYTFATRLVREGASKRAVAEALDHSDLQNVQVYFDVKSDIVTSLDKATALALAPIAQAFLGNIVSAEKTAIRGYEMASRIMVQDRQSGVAEGLGTCGFFSFCGLHAPIACYTCSRFQPWIDGPHERILDDLLNLRERRLEGRQDGRMVAMHDTTILAIGDVITKIAAARSAA